MINFIRVDLQMVTPNVQRRTRRYIFTYLGFVDIYSFISLYIFIFHFVIFYFILFIYLFIYNI